MQDEHNPRQLELVLDQARQLELPYMSQITDEDIRRILAQHPYLTPEAQARHDEFVELMEKTARPTQSDLYLMHR